MNYLATSAIALTIAAGGAFAGSHMSEDDAAMNSNDAATMDTTDDSAMMNSDGNSRMDMSNLTTSELASMQGQLIRSRDITGGNVYTINEADDEGWDPEMRYEAVGADWNQIGEIEDLVLSSDGQIIGIVAEVGGLLDIADKHVVIAVNDLNLVAVDDATYAYVTKYSEEQLEEMEDVDEGFWN